MQYRTFRGLKLLILGCIATASSYLIAADAPKKGIVIVIPGIMGSDLRTDAKENSLVWFDLRGSLAPCSRSILPLTLNLDGDKPASNIPFKCSRDGSTTSVYGAKITVGDLLGTMEPDDPVARLTRIFLYRYSYEHLVSTLNSSFTVVRFPYDWRLNYETIAQQLRKKIEDSTRDSGATVDIVAHSQGGLIARLYLADYPDDPRVRRVVFLGTPQLGAPKSYAILSGWQPFRSYYGSDAYLNFEAESFVTQNFPSTYGLLPRRDFFTRDGRLEPFATTFAKGLSNKRLLPGANEIWGKLAAAPPAKVQLFAINGSGRNTLDGLVQEKNCIVPHDDAKGDGTVPAASSGGLGGVPQMYVKEEHAKLPASTLVADTVVKVLKGATVASLKSDKVSDQPFSEEHLVIHTCSHVNLTIQNQAGLIEGFSEGRVINQIDNAQYFRFPENEAVFLPSGSDYLVVLTGTGEGEALLEVQLFSGEGYPKLHVRFPLQVTKKFRAVFAVDFDHPVLLVDRDGSGTFSDRIRGDTSYSYK